MSLSAKQQGFVVTYGDVRVMQAIDCKKQATDNLILHMPQFEWWSTLAA
jgi:hypothetical protein